jgi:uncharacterized membrane protein
LLGGLAGSLIDSLIGATAQAIYRSPTGVETERHAGDNQAVYPLLRGWRWVNNDMVNFLSALAGGVIGLVVFLLLGE